MNDFLLQVTYETSRPEAVDEPSGWKSRTAAPSVFTSHQSENLEPSSRRNSVCYVLVCVFF